MTLIPRPKEPKSRRYHIFWKDVRAGFVLRVERTGPTSFALRFRKRKPGDRHITLGQHGVLTVHLQPDHEVDIAVLSPQGELLYSTLSGTPSEVRRKLAPDSDRGTEAEDEPAAEEGQESTEPTG